MLLSVPVDLPRDGPVFRRRLHPQRGVQLLATQPFVGIGGQRDRAHHGARGGA